MKRGYLTGILLIVIGLIGMLMVMWLVPSTAARLGAGPQAPFISPGERIYFTGLDSEGRAIPRLYGAGRMRFRERGMGMMGDSCADCHGTDGRGGTLSMMFVTVDVADIRYSALTSPRSEEGTSVPGWTDTDIKRAIVDGVEPDGTPLRPPMPRWDMTDSEVRDVIGYLKELSDR